jgi:hypothetical protein
MNSLLTVLDDMKIPSLSSLLIQCLSALVVNDLPGDKCWCCDSEDGPDGDSEEQ